MRKWCVLVVSSILTGTACGRVGYDVSEAGPSIDAALDAPGLDASLPDAGPEDAGATDAHVELPDAPLLDAAFPDAAFPDGAFPDGGPPMFVDAALMPGETDPRCATIPGVRYDELGSGAPGNPHVLCTADQFASFLAEGPDTLTYVLGADIVTGSWTTRASFLGTLDGNGHELRLTAFAVDPMFLDLSGTVRHLRLRADVDASFLDRAGAVAGACSGEVSDVHLVADFVSGQDETGGLVGQCNACRIADVSVVVARVSGLQRVGGVVGNMFAGSVDRARVQITQIDARVGSGCARLGGIAGHAHDGATIDEAFADVGIVLTTGGAGGIAGELGLGSSARDVAATGNAVFPGGGGCAVGVAGLVGDLGGTVQRGWADMSSVTAGVVDRVALGATLRDVAGLTRGLGSPDRLLRSCALGSTITNTAVLDDGTPATGTLTCAFTAPRTSSDPTYFWSSANAPMSSWDPTTIWAFSMSGLPTLRRVPP